MARILPLVVIVSLVSAGIGAGAVAVLSGEDAARAPDVVPFQVTVTELPPAPVGLTTETVRLGRGFTSRHRHGGPTINLVRAGRVAISDSEGVRRYGPGETFVEPGGHVHTIRVIAATRIDVIRLLPAGAAATTEVTGAGDG